MKVIFEESHNSKLCFVQVSKFEALALIQSLVNQMLAGSPNAGRLESRCKGDAQEFTVVVM